MKHSLLFIVFIISTTCNAQKAEKPLNPELKNNVDYVPSILKNDTMMKHFRTVHIAKGREIPLQGSIDKLKDITRKIHCDYYSFKSGAFGVADSMAVEVDKSGKIVGIIACYDYAPEFSNDTAYIHELHKFQKIIHSDGTEFQYKSKFRTVTVTKWENENTVFELIEMNINNKKNCYSVIFDKELYYKKIWKGFFTQPCPNDCSDLKMREYSLEILKILGSAGA